MGDRASTLEPTEALSRDLFGDSPRRLPRTPAAVRQEPAELRAARALAAQIRHKRTRRDKQQVAHLICLNLISMLKQGARR
jgi:hypothetical protein